MRDVAPCHECGAFPQELEHFWRGLHSYAEFEILPGHLPGYRVVLCNFCMVDFGSHDPTYFGLPRDALLGYGKMRLARSISDPAIDKDLCCPDCGHRLKWLEFVRAARDKGAT